MKRAAFLYVFFVSIGLMINSCSKESVLPPATTATWNRIATIPEISTVSQVVAGPSNIYAVGLGADGYYFISIDKNNQVVEKRPIHWPYKLFLTKDFYATVDNSGNAMGDTTVIKFYSTSLSHPDPMATLNSKKFWSAATTNLFNTADVRFSPYSLSDNSYGVIVRFGPVAATNVDVATIRVDENGVAIVNKQSVGTFVAVSTPYYDNDWMVAYKDKFLVKFPNSLYQYDPLGVVSQVASTSDNYNGLSASNWVRHDSLFMTSGGLIDDNLYYMTDINDTWRSIKNSSAIPNYFVVDNFFVSYNGQALDLYKIDKNSNQLTKYKSDQLSGITNPSGYRSPLVEFKDQVLLFSGNIAYTKPLSAFTTR